MLETAALDVSWELGHNPYDRQHLFCDLALTVMDAL